MKDSFSLQFGKTIISIRADSEKIIKPLSDYLKNHLADSAQPEAEVELQLKKIISPIPTNARLSLRYYAVKVFYLAGFTYFTDFRSFIILEPEAKKAQGFISEDTFEESGIHFFTHNLFTIFFFELLRHYGIYFIHSAGLVSPEGKAYLFPANGGEGKSTLSAYLLNQGYRYLSDDVIFISRKDAGLDIQGFKKFSHIPDEVISRFKELRAFKNASSLDGKGKRVVDLFKVYPDQIIEQASAKKYVMIFPKKVSREKSRLLPVDSQQAFNLLLYQTPLVFIHPKLVKDHLRIISDLVKVSRGWILESGTDWLSRPEILTEILAKAGADK